LGSVEPALVFTGFMGAGKSSAARIVAAELGVAAVDSDHELERELREPIESWFDRHGEAAFRAAEEEVVLRLLAREDLRVLALGGGALGSESVRAALQRHTVVYLDVDPESAWRRANSGQGRPLARDHGRFVQLHRERSPVYEDVADAWLPATERSTARDALDALLALGRAEVRPKLLWAVASSSQYPVFFGRGLLGSTFFFPDGRRYVVTDENVRRNHPLGGAWEDVIPPGEQAKTPAQAEDVLRRMAQAGVTRSDLVVAVGGGVVGDLAGFCAAAYQRGMPWVGVPTTLVAQVDSAYGGKTGVDLPEGKNYMGAYHNPASVIVDPGALGSLPPAELAAGYAEVVKTALIAGGRLWARVRRGGGAVDDETILHCIRTKLEVVRQDERDSGPRQVLNLGHTVAHAIESATGYARYRHGEAVALGLLCALRLSERPQLLDEVAELLRAARLPTTLDGLDPELVLPYLERDKKRVGERVPFVLVESPGTVTHGHEVEPRSVRAALEELR
jgi:shikimate kinase/3-dehydroquinate synthase